MTRITIVPTIRTKSKIVTVERAVHNISDVTRAGVYHIRGYATEIRIVRKTKTNLKRVATRITILVSRVTSNVKIISVFREGGDVIMKAIVAMDQMKRVSAKL